MILSCVLASTQRELDDAAQLRWKVFGAEQEFIPASEALAGRELNGFDTLRTTRHFVVYDGSAPVAAARLLLPNPEVARLASHRVGLDVERKFDLGPLVEEGLSLAETTRFCVTPSHRGSRAFLLLVQALHEESRTAGVTHWIAAANTETDSLEDARLIVRLAQEKGLVDARFHLPPRGAAFVRTAPRHPFFTDAQRRRAASDDFTGLALPKTLGLYTRKVGARVIGSPTRDPYFRMCSVPILVALNDLPLHLQHARPVVPARVRPDDNAFPAETR